MDVESVFTNMEKALHSLDDRYSDLISGANEAEAGKEFLSLYKDVQAAKTESAKVSSDIDLLLKEKQTIEKEISNRFEGISSLLYSCLKNDPDYKLDLQLMSDQFASLDDSQSSN